MARRYTNEGNKPIANGQKLWNMMNTILIWLLLNKKLIYDNVDSSLGSSRLPA